MESLFHTNVRCSHKYHRASDGRSPDGLGGLTNLNEFKVVNPFQFASHFLSNYIRQHFGAKIPKDSSLYLLMMTGSPLAIQTKTSHKNQAENHSTSFIFKQKKTSTRNDSPYDLHEPHPFLSNCFIHPQRCPWSQEDTREHSVPMEIVTSPSPSSLETSEVKIFCAYVWWKKMVKLW